MRNEEFSGDPSRDAADISSSCFVFASAGSGKTKILVDRYVRSMFLGVRPSEILCLTFTNAAVFEMGSRISDILKDLYLNVDGFTKKYLQNFVGIREPDEKDISKAESLFFKFQDDLQDIKILTIHSFCQNILKEFPIEAGISPDFEIADELTSSRLINLAKNNVLEQIDRLGGEEAILSLSNVISGYSFDELINRISSDSLRFTKFFNEYTDLDVYRKHLEKLFKKTEAVDFTEKQASIISEVFRNVSLEEVFLTKSGELRKKYQNDEIAKIVFANLNNKKIDAVIEKTVRFLEMARIILNEYTRLKTVNCMIDFADVLYLTESLLQHSHAKEFVLSHVCSEINGIMIDEAQDLSPIQWKIISLCSEDIISDPQSNKTVFVVGDVKQSIYRFHGADCKLFLEIHEHWKTLLTSMGKSFRTVHISVNYRSLGKILGSVDDVFEGTFDYYKRHIPHRDPFGGEVKLVEVKDDDEQAITIAEYIKSLNLPPSDVLILTRSRTELSNHLMAELNKIGIKVAPPDRISLSENLLIMDITALAEICITPDNDYKLVCLLKSPYLFETPLSNDDLFALRNNDENLLNSLRMLHPEKWQMINLVMQAYKPYNLIEFFYWIVTILVRRQGQEDDHIISSFMNEVIRFSQKEPGDISEFLESFKEGDVYISSQNTKDNGVRLSTIHGAKGLESPTVCLLDFDLSPDKSKTKFVWINRNFATCFFVKPSQSESTDSINEILNMEYSLESDELMRLLYVAMTRAQDQLIVFGRSDGCGAYSLIKKHSRTF